jgi:DNA-binding Lrp family transcriptional regulator
MPRAFILVNVDPGAEEQAIKQLKSIEGVEESYVTYGVYDLMVRVKADTIEELKDIVTQNTNPQAGTLNTNIDNDGRIRRKYSHFK